MRTPEQILDSVVRDWSTPITRPVACDAMHDYAREVAVHYAHNLFKKVYGFNVPDELPEEAYKLFDQWYEIQTKE